MKPQIIFLVSDGVLDDYYIHSVWTDRVKAIEVSKSLFEGFVHEYPIDSIPEQPIDSMAEWYYKVEDSQHADGLKTDTPTGVKRGESWITNR